ncbi:MAG: 2-amino-4-hydroxy-6-hydroxymethyldihydropteridine diphosphokinase [Phycisphaerae bacterium]
MTQKKTKEHKPVEVYIALGSNIEPRGKYIQRALNLINDHPKMEVQTVSSVYETQPDGGPPDQKLYLNAAANIRTTLGVTELLDALQAIEKELGRKREVFWGARTIDLDILIYGQEIISTDRLIIPHPLMHERRFVMQPLAQIAPHVVHPVLLMTAQTILESMDEVE